MPDLASRNEARTSWVLLPIEDTIPIPVTTTRLIARPFLASSCRSSLCQTRTRRMTHPSQGCWLLAGCKEPDAKIGGSVDHLAVGLHHSVGNGKLQAAQDHPLQVDDVLHGLGCGHDHAGKLNLAHAQRPTLARRAEPAQKKAGKLPKRIEPQAARHHGVALEMAGEKPIERGVARHLELGHHLTLAVRAAHLRDPGNAIKHQHGGQRQLGIARAEQLATATGEQICVFVGCNALGHRPPSTKCRCANATCLYLPTPGMSYHTRPPLKSPCIRAQKATIRTTTWTLPRPERRHILAKNGKIQSCGTGLPRYASALGGGPHRQSLCYGQLCFSTPAPGRVAADASAHRAGNAAVRQRRSARDGGTPARGGRAGGRARVARHGLQYAAPIQGGRPLARNRHRRPARLLRYEHVKPQPFLCRGRGPPGRHPRRLDPRRWPARAAARPENFAYRRGGPPGATPLSAQRVGRGRSLPPWAPSLCLSGSLRPDTRPTI